MAAEVRWVCFAVCVITQLVTIQADPSKRFEYKFSFKPPYLAQKDGTVPFWEYGGNAIASSENVRIAPSLRSQKGAIWTKSQTTFDWWEIDIVFRVTGRGRIGADGLAFWYTESKGAYDGPVFGSSDKWKGLGIFFDSFDNDNKHNNPYIMAILNDGTREFDHQNDGTTQLLAGCLRDFRNKPFPTRAKIEYYQNTLTVLFHNGMTNNEADIEVCLRAENVHLPPRGHFGLSAATGGLADDHDVLHFLTTSLHPPGSSLPGQDTARVSDEEQRKLAEEYAEYQKKLDQKKEEYHREHPDAAKKNKDNEFEGWFESDSQRELSQIFHGQSQMFDALRELSRKLDEVVGRQERTLSMLSAVQVGAPVGGQPGQAGQPQIHMIDSIKRHEVDAVLSNQNTIISAAREIKNVVQEVHARADNILQNQARAPTAQVQSVGYDMVSLVSELRDGMNGVKRDLAATSAKLSGSGGGGGGAPAGCPQVNCLSLTMFLVFTGIQLILLLGYSIYKDSREAQAKKFY